MARKRIPVVKPRADDDDDWLWEDEVQDVGSGSVTGLDAESELSSRLIKLIEATTGLKVLLEEIDSEEFDRNRTRLESFLAIVGSLPRKPTPKRQIGFKPPELMVAKPPAPVPPEIVSLVKPPAKKPRGRRKKS